MLEQWNKFLTKSAITRKDYAKDPQAVLDMLEFYILIIRMRVRRPGTSLLLPLPILLTTPIFHKQAPQRDSTPAVPASAGSTSSRCPILRIEPDELVYVNSQQYRLFLLFRWYYHHYYHSTTTIASDRQVLDRCQKQERAGAEDEYEVKQAPADEYRFRKQAAIVGDVIFFVCDRHVYKLISRVSV